MGTRDGAGLGWDWGSLSPSSGLTSARIGFMRRTANEHAFCPRWYEARLRKRGRLYSPRLGYGPSPPWLWVMCVTHMVAVNEGPL